MLQNANNLSAQHSPRAEYRVCPGLRYIVGMVYRAAAVALTCCVFATSPCFGWWETGHRVVARVAAAHLTPAARVRVSRILGVPDTPQALTEALAKASTWADETKTATNTGEWHYIDLALQDTRADIPKRCPGGNCAPARIRSFSSQLAAQKSDGRWSEADALRFVVHLVGDIHQPLHAASDADLGGNCELLNPPVGEAKNVHALWDGQIVNEMNGSDVTISTGLESYLKELGLARQNEWSGGTPDDWAWDSHELARQNIYGKLHIPLEPVVFPHGCKEAPTEITDFKAQVDALYIDSMKPVVRDQLAKAGLRLARVLNEAL